MYSPISEEDSGVFYAPMLDEQIDGFSVRVVRACEALAMERDEVVFAKDIAHSMLLGGAGRCRVQHILGVDDARADALQKIHISYPRGARAFGVCAAAYLVSMHRACDLAVEVACACMARLLCVMVESTIEMLLGDLVAEDADGVVRVRMPDGAHNTLTVRWLYACDGACDA